MRTRLAARARATHDPSPIAASTFGGDMGSSRRRSPKALWMALATVNSYQTQTFSSTSWWKMSHTAHLPTRGAPAPRTPGRWCTELLLPHTPEYGQYGSMKTTIDIHDELLARPSDSPRRRASRSGRS